MTALRIAGWLACGLVLGFVLGTLPAERERSALEARVAELERALRRVDRPSILDSFLPRLGGERAAPGVAADAPASRAPDAAVPMPSAPMASAPPSRAAPDARPAPRGDVAVIGEAPERRRGFFGRWRDRRRAPRGGLEVRGDPDGARGEDRPRLADVRGDGALGGFDELAAVQRARAAASRAALIEQAGLDAEQVARVDATVERMNGQLAGYGEEMIDQMVREEPPGPAQALGLGHDVSGILLEGQQALDGIVGEAAEQVDPSAMEVWNFVDIEQWRPFLEARAQTAPDAPGAPAAPAAPSGEAGSGAAPSGE